MDTNGRFVIQQLKMSDEAKSSSTASINEVHEERRHISLPNPFKALGARSAETLPLIGEKDMSSSTLKSITESSVVSGDVALHGPIKGVRMWRRIDEHRGIVWSQHTLSVSMPLLTFISLNADLLPSGGIHLRQHYSDQLITRSIRGDL